MSTDWLDQLTGDWTYEGDSIPSDLARTRTGTEIVTRRGAWVVIESDDDVRFQLSFNKETGRVTGDFISWEYAGLWVYDGAPDGRRMALASRGPRMDGAPGETDYEDIWEIVSADERVTTGRFRNDAGEWQDFNVTRYRRKA